jgi:hypothetical protein
MGSGRLEAQPGGLSGGSGRAAALAGELAGLGGPLSVASQGAGGGPPGAQAAIEECCGQWALALGALAHRAGALERNLAGAAGAYVDTDGSAMPG